MLWKRMNFEGALFLSNAIYQIPRRRLYIKMVERTLRLHYKGPTKYQNRLDDRCYDPVSYS